MRDICHCGHKPGDHYGDTGRCEHQERTLFGDFAVCTCPRYEYEGDE